MAWYNQHEKDKVSLFETIWNCHMVSFSVVSKTYSYLILSIKLFHIFSIDSFSPYRIVDDCGAAFAMGAIGGGLFSFVKGWRNAPVVSWRLSIISCVNIYWLLLVFSSKTSVPSTCTQYKPIVCDGGANFFRRISRKVMYHGEALFSIVI